MTFSFAKNRFASVSWIERALPRRVRGYLGYAAMGAILASFFLPSVRLLTLGFALWLLLIMLNAYARSRASDIRGDATDENIARRFNYYASTVWRAASDGMPRSVADLAAGFDRAPAGRAIMTRLGISEKIYQEAIGAPSGAPSVPVDPISLLAHIATTNQEISSGDLLILLVQNCIPIKNMMLAAEITEDDIRGAATWVERSLNEQNRKERWWSREQLARIPGIGKQWTYSRIYYLHQFGRELTGETHGAITGRETELHLLETALMKQSGANALLVGDPGAGKKTILATLASRIREGIVSPLLEHKRVIVLESAAITGSAKTKGNTEALLINIFNEAAGAGNIVLVISAFPEFVASLSSLGINAGQILGSYLNHPSLHIVGLADTAPFRHSIAEDAGLLSHFETIYLAGIDRDRLIGILEDRASTLEAAYRGKILITYPALRAVADAALNHLTEGALPKRAIDLLEEAAAGAKDITILPQHITQIVSIKTHLPMGAIAGEERAALQNLESTLHARVIGQDEAIAAIANTIRRSRTGIRNPRRPIGSFLFLGPTGVGKTESAKALAAVYFGDEERMIRFDMSEYQTEEDVAKLLGSTSRNEPGILASAVRRQPYGILLLDEFEKSRLEIRNIFLTILDEGFFTNAPGDRVILRDMIIIATSNAGALFIQDMLARGENPTLQKSALIENIEKEAHLAPELLNRFDSLVIFSPLDATALRAVAGLMLVKLATRLKEQNYILDITPELIDATATGGFDPQFGARPMQRWIQDHIEKSITDGILTSSIAPGAPFRINPADFSITD